MPTIRKLALGLTLLLTLTACAGPAASSPSPSPSGEPSETPAAEPAAPLDSQALRELVDWQADEYLAGDCATQEEALEHLELRAVCPGLELEDGTAATMALFTVTKAPHLAGLQRTIVLLLDEAMKPLGQHTIVADIVDPYLIDKSHVLFIQAACYTGDRTYCLTLLKARAEGWTDQTGEMGLPLTDEADPAYYSVSLDRVHIFEVIYREQPTVQPEYRYLRTLCWEGGENGGFREIIVP